MDEITLEANRDGRQRERSFRRFQPAVVAIGASAAMMAPAPAHAFWENLAPAIDLLGNGVFYIALAVVIIGLLAGVVMWIAQQRFPTGMAVAVLCGSLVLFLGAPLIGALRTATNADNQANRHTTFFTYTAPSGTGGGS